MKPNIRSHSVCIISSWITAFFITVVAAEQHGHFTYQVHQSYPDRVTITNYPTTEVGHVDVPAVIDGKSVTHIGESAFEDCVDLTSITLPNSVTSIARSAFESCWALETINIPDGVNWIRRDTFRDCFSLSSITIPGSVLAIEQFAFYQCNALSSITLTEGVGALNQYALANCINLQSIDIPASIYSIGVGVFTGCTSLMEINVAVGNSNYQSIGGVLYNDDATGLMTFPSGKAGAFTIPEGTGFVFASAFNGASELTGVTFPSSLTAIGNLAFFGCTGLNTVSLPASMTAVGVRAFMRCSNITSFSWPDNVAFSSEVFKECRNLQAIDFPTGVSNIGPGAFDSCTGLSNLVIPANITQIDAEAFANCSGLSEVNFREGLTTIGDKAFSRCFGLGEITFPSTLETLGKGAFEHCSAINQIALPAVVSTIDDGAFFFCGSLESACFLGNAPTFGVRVFDHTDANFLIYFPEGATGFTTPSWNGYPVALVQKIQVEYPFNQELESGISIVDIGSDQTPSGEITFTIRNTGDKPLENLSVAISGDHAGDFSVQPLAETSLPSGATMQFPITFTASSTGQRNSNLVISSNDPFAAVFTIGLQGVGLPESNFSDWKHSFGSSSAAATSDNDNDSITLLEEYAFNLEPNDTNYQVLAAGNGTAGVPNIRVIREGGNYLLEFEYIRRRGDVNLSYAVQLADELSETSWENATGTETVSTIDNYWERVTIRDTETSTTKSKRYGRVHVEIISP